MSFFKNWTFQKLYFIAESLIFIVSLDNRPVMVVVQGLDGARPSYKSRDGDSVFLQNIIELHQNAWRLIPQDSAAYS
jgi:hypothetical protein